MLEYQKPVWNMRPSVTKTAQDSSKQERRKGERESRKRERERERKKEGERDRLVC